MPKANKKPTPKFRQYSIGQIVNDLEGKQRNKPEVCYQFSNGVQKVDTDRTDSGVYEK